MGARGLDRWLFRRKGLLNLALYPRIGTIMATLGRKRRFRMKRFEAVVILLCLCSAASVAQGTQPMFRGGPAHL